MQGARLHKTSRRDAVARDPRRDLLGRDRDILLRDRDETLVRLETVSRPRRLDRDVSTETTSLWTQQMNKLRSITNQHTTFCRFVLAFTEFTNCRVGLILPFRIKDALVSIVATLAEVGCQGRALPSVPESNLPSKLQQPHQFRLFVATFSYSETN